MKEYKRHRSDVARWPDDKQARDALGEYLDTIAARNADTAASGECPIPYLAGDFLDFRGADLSGLDLPGAYLVGARLTGIRFVASHLGASTLSDADLCNADFSRADLTKSEMVGCAMREACFREARIFATDLIEADLERADLRWAVLTSSVLLGAVLRNAMLQGAAMHECGLGTDHMPVNIDGANMADCMLHGAYGVVTGSVFVSKSQRTPVGGGDLESWFQAQGAHIRVLAEREPR